MIEDFSGIEHHFGEGRELGAVHSANPHGHKPRGHLVIGNFPPGVAGNQKIDFLAGKFSGITFLTDQVDGAHAFGKRVASVTFAWGSVNARPTPGCRQTLTAAAACLEAGWSPVRRPHASRWAC